MAATNVKATFSTEAIMALPQNVPSLCIPRVFPNITWQRVKETFEELDFGTVERVDMVNKTSPKGEPIKRVFVHFSKWNTENPEVTEARRQMMEGDAVQITYDDPWFWRCYKSNVPRPSHNKARDTPKTRTPEKTKDGFTIVKTQRKGKKALHKKPADDDKTTIKCLRDEIADLKKLVTGMAQGGFPNLGSHAPKKDVSKRPKKAHTIKPKKLTFLQAATAPAPIAIPQQPTTPTPSSPAYAPTSPPVIERQTQLAVDDEMDWADMVDDEIPVPATP